MGEPAVNSYPLVHYLIGELEDLLLKANQVKVIILKPDLKLLYMIKSWEIQTHVVTRQNLQIYFESKKSSYDTPIFKPSDHVAGKNDARRSL